MAVRVVPTLEAMAAVYRCSTEGGPDSERFRAYVELGRQGVPVSGYNPMTSKDVLPTVEALLDLDAESEVARTMSRCAEALGLDEDLETWMTVATPGMWTDRLATEVEHRFLGRTTREVLWWFDDPPRRGALRAVAAEQAVRLAWAVRHGAPATVADAAGQEGLAAAMATRERDPGAAQIRPDGDDPAVAEALEVVGDDPGVGTMVAVLHGDDAAASMGWTPLGIGSDAGYRYCRHAALVALQDHSPAELLARRWSP